MRSLASRRSAIGWMLLDMGLPVPPRVHVEPAGQDDAVEPVEEGVDLRLLAQRRQEDGHPAGGQDGVEVPGVDAGVGRVRLGGGEVVGVDADERARAVLGGHDGDPPWWRAAGDAAVGPERPCSGVPVVRGD